MSAAFSSTTAVGKTSSDSGQNSGLDRWSQRRLQRLNTEQGFREQRQGGGAGIASPPANDASSHYSASNPAAPHPSTPSAPAQPHQQAQAAQLPASQPSYQAASRTGQGPQSNTQQRTSNAYGADQSQSYALSQQYTSPDDGQPHSASDSSRPHIASQRSQSYTQQATAADPSMSSNPNNGSALKAARSGNSNRQSVHSGLSAQQGVPAFNAAVVPTSAQQQAYQSAQAQQQQQSQQQPQTKDVGRVTPQPVQTGEDMTDEDINQLIKDHRELRRHIAAHSPLLHH